MKRLALRGNTATLINSKGNSMRRYLPVILTIFAFSSFAQDAPTSRNATASEIQGNWQLLPLPAALEPNGSSNPWPSECQLFGYYPTGELKSIDKSRGPCATITSNQEDRVFAAVPHVVTWRYDMSPTYHKAVIVVTRSDVGNYMEVWDPQLVTTPFSKDGVDFKQGDLILYLANLHDHKIAWIRHLRRLP
jgi:hypothetical protein